MHPAAVEAADPTTPPRRLSELAAAYPAAVAANPNARLATLFNLASQALDAVLANPALRLQLLSTDPQALPLQRGDAVLFMRHPNTPPLLQNAILERAAEGGGTHFAEVGAALLGNPAADPDALLRLEAEIRHVRQHNGSSAWLRLRDVRRHVNHPHAILDQDPYEILVGFLRYRALPWVEGKRVLREIHLPVWMQKWVAVKHIIGLALNPHTAPSVLDDLASRAKPEAQKALAQRSDLAPASYVAIAHTRSDRVRLTLAHNPHVPAEALAVLASHGNINVQLRVARHPNCPPELVAPILDKLKLGDRITPADPDAAATVQAARQTTHHSPVQPDLFAPPPELPPTPWLGLRDRKAILTALTNDLTAWTVVASAYGLSPEVQAVLTEGVHPATRIALAMNPTITDAVRERLRRDPDLAVRAAADAEPRRDPA